MPNRRTTASKLKASAEIAKLPAGALAMAVGGDARKETLTQDFNPALNSGDITGFGGNFPNIAKDRKNQSVFAEFNIPIVKTLEANVGGPLRPLQ